METHGFAVKVDPDGGFIPGIARSPNGDFSAREFVRLVLLMLRPTGRHQHLHHGHEVTELGLRGRRGLFRPIANVLRGARGCGRRGRSSAALFGYGSEMHAVDGFVFRGRSRFRGRRSADGAARGAGKFESPIRRAGVGILLDRTRSVRCSERRRAVFQNFLQALAQFVAVSVLALRRLRRRFARSSGGRPFRSSRWLRR